MRDKTWHVDEIEGAIADDLISDAVVVALGVSGRRSNRAHSAGIIGSPFLMHETHPAPLPRAKPGDNIVS